LKWAIDFFEMPMTFKMHLYVSSCGMNYSDQEVWQSTQDFISGFNTGPVDIEIKRIPMKN